MHYYQPTLCVSFFLSCLHITLFWNLCFNSLQTITLNSAKPDYIRYSKLILCLYSVLLVPFLHSLSTFTLLSIFDSVSCSSWPPIWVNKPDYDLHVSSMVSQIFFMHTIMKSYFCVIISCVLAGVGVSLAGLRSPPALPNPHLCQILCLQPRRSCALPGLCMFCGRSLGLRVSSLRNGKILRRYPRAAFLAIKHGESMQCLFQSEVLRTKSTECMAFPLSMANFLVAIEWFTYGYLMRDLYIQVSDPCCA